MKEKSDIQVSQGKIRDNLTKLSSRIEALERQEQLNKIQMRNIQNTIKSKIEEANLNMVANLDEMNIQDDS